MRVPAFFSDYQQLADDELRRLVPDRGEAVQRAMAYTVLAPSKRVRPRSIDDGTMRYPDQ